MSSPAPSPWTARRQSIARGLADPDVVLIVLMIGALAYALYETAFWRMRHDLPMMMYQAFLMNERGFVPYRDFFDMNLPGTYLTYRLIGVVFGYGDFGARVADWCVLATIWGTTLGFLRGLPRRAVIAGLLLFSMSYLRAGGAVTLQREYLALPIVISGLWAATAPWSWKTRAFVVGLAFGVAATFKPHLVIGVVPPALWIAWEAPRESRVRTGAGVLLAVAAGGAVPLAIVAAWLTARGLWEPFLHSLNYLVYYGQLDTTHTTVPADERVAYLAAQTLRLGTFAGAVAVGAFGIHRGLWAFGLEGEPLRKVQLLVGAMVAFLIYPTGSGQFWSYHWLPLLYVSCVSAGFLVGPTAKATAAWIPRVVLAFAFLQAADAGNGMAAFRASIMRVPAEGRPDRIARFLEDHMEPGDVVQPFDWVSGGVAQGLLLAEATPATPYVYTFHFYHHVSTTYIQRLRTDFMARLQASPPAFVVASTALWPFVVGEDTTSKFESFDEWLAANYQPALQRDKLAIWERTDHMLARGGTPAEFECDPRTDPECEAVKTDVWSTLSEMLKDRGKSPRDGSPRRGEEGEGEDAPDE